MKIAEMKGLKKEMLSAVENDNTDELGSILQRGMDKDLQFGLSKNTALHYTCIHGSPDCAELLLEHGADPNIENCECHPPLYYCLWHRNPKAAKLVLEAGADIDKCSGGIKSIFEARHRNEMKKVLAPYIKV